MVKIPISENQYLEEELLIPNIALGVVLFALGRGSSRFSPRNQTVAQYLKDQQLGTLLIDLLTSDEDEIDQISRKFRFNIEMLSDGLVKIIDWLTSNQDTKQLPIGLFGSSTGAASVLIAAAQKKSSVAVIVSRGGKPDLAETYLQQVICPTLFIVGGGDTIVNGLNEQAYDQLHFEKKIEIIPNATHLFEEPGKLKRVAQLSAQWFRIHFSSEFQT